MLVCRCQHWAQRTALPTVRFTELLAWLWLFVSCSDCSCLYVYFSVVLMAEHLEHQPFTFTDTPGYSTITIPCLSKVLLIYGLSHTHIDTSKPENQSDWYLRWGCVCCWPKTKKQTLTGYPDKTHASCFPQVSPHREKIPIVISSHSSLGK